MPTGTYIVLCALNLIAPLVWVALFNFVGLKRIVERLEDLEHDQETVRNKTRSLQSQIGKKSKTQGSVDQDEEISREIASFVKSEPGEPTKLNRGGLVDAGSN